MFHLRALELAMKHDVLVDAVLKSRKEYLADLKNQPETIQLFLDAEKKFGSTTKKKTKVVSKKREKIAAPTLDVEEGSGDFSLQPTPASLSGKVDMDSSSMAGIANNDVIEESKLLDEQFSLSAPSNPRSNDANAGSRKNTFDVEKELEVDDFY